MDWNDLLLYARYWGDELPNFAELPDGVWSLGTTKYTCQALKVSYLANWAKVWVRENDTDFFVTFSELARIALKERLKLLGKKRANFNRMPLLSHPLYAVPGEYEGIYVYADLKSAYHSVLRDYYPCVFVPDQQLLSCPHEFDDRLFNLSSKPAKVSTFGAIRSSSLNVLKIKNGELVTYSRRTCNPFYNDAVNLVYFYCHLFAGFAIRECGGIYAHTDGVIIPRSKYPLLEEFCYRLGFRLGQKAQGTATIKGVGVYALGMDKTLSFDRVTPTAPFSNLVEVPEWLLMRFLRVPLSSRSAGRAVM